jgi:TonB family protein
LGQLYNGETGKGLLFLVVFAANIVLLAACVFHEAFLGLVSKLSANFNLVVDPQAIDWFSKVPAGSPFLLIYAGLILTFVAYSAREAYDRAALTQQGAVYPKFFLGLPEATSGSYLFHFAVIVCGTLILLFMVVPKPPIEQVTEILLVPPRPAAKPKPKEPPAPKQKVELPKPVVTPKVEQKPVTKPEPVKTEPVKTEPTPSPVTAAPGPDATASSAAPGPSAPASDAGGSSSDAGAGGGGGEAADIDFGPYLAELQKRIKKNWHPPRGNESKRITAKFKIHLSGEITNIKLERSSGLSIADDAAVDAIEKSSPLPPLPKGADSDLVIKFTFDYNVFNGASQSAAGSGAVSN